MTDTLGSMIAAARSTVPEVPPAEAYDAQQRDEVHLIIEHGYDSVEVLGGGLNAWTEAGLPVERASS